MTAYRRLRPRLDALKKHLRGKLLFAESLARYTTLGVGGPAEALFVPEDAQDLAQGLALSRQGDIPWVVIGNGSNLLVRDGGIRGLVIHTARLASLSEAAAGGEGRVMVTAEAGLILSHLVNRCVREALTGLEWAAGIPGTVGGAVVMNAGALGSSVADSMAWAEVATEEGSVERLERDRIACSYRCCAFPMPAVVTAAGFLLTPAPEQEVLDRVKQSLREREKRLPFGWMNAGSIFKNPPGDHAGRLIEAAGFKKKRVGGAMVSEKHANVIVNMGDATARDFLALMEEIVKTVSNRFGVQLVPEVKIVGES